MQLTSPDSKVAGVNLTNFTICISNLSAGSLLQILSPNRQHRPLPLPFGRTWWPLLFASDFLAQKVGEILIYVCNCAGWQFTFYSHEG